MSASLFMAFRSGALAYECAGCGRCCHGLGFADDRPHLAASAELARVSAFAREPSAPGPLVSFYTYADGCRFFGDGGLCTLHRARGPAAKPRICRLFPFSRLVDVGGMWALTPHPDCPWRAAPPGGSDLSAHADLESELDPELLVALSPHAVTPATAMDPGARLRLETTLRDGIDMDGELDAALVFMREAHQTHAAPAAEAAPLDLWLDLLRCAGEPPPLTGSETRLVLAALPALRLALVERFPLATLPSAIAASVLWLRALGELGRPELTGQDLLHLIEEAKPLLAVLVAASLPAHDVAATTPPVAQVCEAVGARAGDALGEVLARYLRADDVGALSFLVQLGQNIRLNAVF